MRPDENWPDGVFLPEKHQNSFLEMRDHPRPHNQILVEQSRITIPKKKIIISEVTSI